ncbi:MAG TPA: DUF2589 domain-containing protein [Thermoanaerobaculia bacterium]|jgi:hypothetical protein|nr:DUF2589 domain-containing protein [Thermoanaerobaculia bacterium]
MATDPGQELSSINFSNMIGSPLRAVIEAQAEAALSTVNFIKAVGFKQGTSTDPEAGNTGDPIYVTFKYPKELAPYQPFIATIATATVVIAGSGFAPNSSHAMTFAGGDGSGMAGTATADATGAIKSVTITSVGTNYTQAPTFKVTAPAAVDATATTTAIPAGTDASGTVELRVGQPEAPAVFQQMSLDVPILTILPIPFIRIEEFNLAFNAKIDSMESTQVDTSTSISGTLNVNQRWWGGSANLSVSASSQNKSVTGTEVQRSYALSITVKAIQDDMPRGMEKVLGILERAMREQPSTAPLPVPVALPAPTH